MKTPKMIALILLLNFPLYGQDSLKEAFTPIQIHRIKKGIKIATAIGVGIGSFYFTRNYNLPKSVPYIISGAMGVGIVIELSNKKGDRKMSKKKQPKQ
jgi:hypothetical protein